MALILSMRRGDDFFVGEERFIIDKVETKTKFFVRHICNKWIGRVRIPSSRMYEITDAHAVEVVPDVFISAGLNNTGGMIRVAIEAPYHVLILHGDKKRNPPAHVLARMQQQPT